MRLRCGFFANLRQILNHGKSIQIKSGLVVPFIDHHRDNWMCRGVLASPCSRHDRDAANRDGRNSRSIEHLLSSYGRRDVDRPHGLLPGETNRDRRYRGAGIVRDTGAQLCALTGTDRNLERRQALAVDIAGQPI